MHAPLVSRALGASIIIIRFGFFCLEGPLIEGEEEAARGPNTARAGQVTHQKGFEDKDRISRNHHGVVVLF